MTQSKKLHQEEVIREFPPIGSKYRVRILVNPKTHQRTLDVREYIVASGGSSFEGYTRRGIRLTDRAQLDLLRDILKEILELSIV